MMADIYRSYPKLTKCPSCVAFPTANTILRRKNVKNDIQSEQNISVYSVCVCIVSIRRNTLTNTIH